MARSAEQLLCNYEVLRLDPEHSCKKLGSIETLICSPSTRRLGEPLSSLVSHSSQSMRSRFIKKLSPPKNITQRMIEKDM